MASLSERTTLTEFHSKPIRVVNTSVNNLKGLTCEFPHGELSVVCGPSGSGKSSLVFGTIYREFLSSVLHRPQPFLDALGVGPVTQVEAMSFTVGLRLAEADLTTKKKKTSVASYTKLLAPLLYLSKAQSKPGFTLPVNRDNTDIEHNLETILAHPKAALLVLLINLKKRSPADAISFANTWSALGFPRFLVRDRLCEMEELEVYLEGESLVEVAATLDYFPCHSTSIFRLKDALELAKTIADGTITLAWTNSLTDTVQTQTDQTTRLAPTTPSPTDQATSNISELLSESVSQLLSHPLIRSAQSLSSNITNEQIVFKVIDLIRKHCELLSSLGLSYLELSRPLSTLSSGELQRLRLARAMQFAFSGTTYLLEHPTSGLHPDEVNLVFQTIRNLVKEGHTVICTSHEPALVDRASKILHLGPKSGKMGGKILAAAHAQPEVPQSAQPTPATRTDPTATSNWIELKGLRAHHLKAIDMQIPLGKLTTIMGVSGSGKSTLLRECLAPALRLALRLKRNKTTINPENIASANLPLESIAGYEQVVSLTELWRVTHSRSLSSTVARLTGLDQLLRERFALTPEARIRGYTSRHFSRFSRLGACPECRGRGYLSQSDEQGNDRSSPNNRFSQYLRCDYCLGKGLLLEVGSITCHGKTFFETQSLTIEETLELFGKMPKVRSIARKIVQAGLGYLALSQLTRELALGELQRLRFSTLTAKHSLIGTVFILDEPTAGLTTAESAIFLNLTKDAISQGATVILAEHNLTAAKASDYLIELGPGAGADGGLLIDSGTPSQLVERKLARVAKYL